MANGDIYGRSGQKLNGSPNTDGYLKTNVLEGEVYRPRYFHRMVCEAFHGPPPPDKPFALHKNGNNQDNRAENLYWGSHQDNMDDMVRHGTQIAPKGEDHGRAKLTWDQVREIRTKYSAGDITQKQLGDEHGVSKPLIGRIVRGEVWK